MGWNPESGFLDAQWKGYNEAMVLLVMALGSPSHPIPEGSWQEWTKTYKWGKYYDQEMVNFGPLFGHQYSHMYIDFRGIQDAYMKEKGIDYFENSRRATYANRAYCINNPSGFTGYSENVWGLTACDGPGNEGKSDPNISFMGYSARVDIVGNQFPAGLTQGEAEPDARVAVAGTEIDNQLGFQRHRQQPQE